MHTTLKTSVATVALAALAALPVATGTVLLSADTAVAQAAQAAGQGSASGGRRGSSRGDDARTGPPADRGPDADNPGRGAPDGSKKRGRGAMASALGALNAANANQAALENAAPNSMPGKLYAYQKTGGISVAEIGAYSDARSMLSDVQAARAADGDGVVQATEDGFLARLDVNGDGQIDDADVARFQATVDDFQDAYTALANLGDGSLTLTADRLAEMNRMLFDNDG